VKGFEVCDGLINHGGDGILTLDICQLLVEVVIGNPFNPKFNLYDIRTKCDVPPMCYDMTNADKLLNIPDIQSRLGVAGREWVECNKMVHTKLLGDWVASMEPKVADILEKGIEVLVYSGDKDFICNWRGGEAWTNAVNWSGKAQFNAAEYSEWTVNGKSAGALRQYKNLKFLRVYDAGHMVPMDQPENALSMLKTFITGDIFKKNGPQFVQ